MKRFFEYYQMKEEEKALGDIDAMPDEDEVLLKMAKMAIDRHQDRLLDFLQTLAKHDEGIKFILDKFKEKRRDYMPQDLRMGTKDIDKDIVAPSSADMSDPL